MQRHLFDTNVSHPEPDPAAGTVPHEAAVPSGEGAATLAEAQRAVEDARHLVSEERPSTTVEGARLIVDDFRRDRDRCLGRPTAAHSELRDPVERIDQAIWTIAGSLTQPLAGAYQANRHEQRRLAEDLVDLQSFVNDQDLALLSGYRPDLDRQVPTLDDRAASPEGAYARLMWRRARVIHRLRDDIATPLGALNALAQLRRPMMIGDSRMALEAVRWYREKQAGLIVGGYGWAAAAAFIVLVLHPPVLVIGALLATWFLIGPFIGGGTFRALDALYDRVLRIPPAAGVMAVLLSGALAALAVAAVAWWLAESVAL